MKDKQHLLGIFIYLDDLLNALKALKEARQPIETVYSPVRRDEIQEAMGLRPSAIRVFTLVGGVFGGIAGVSLASYAHLRWNLITSGKPILAWIPFVVVFFEALILISVLFNVISMVVKGRMPRRHLPITYDTRFTQDRFGILVSCAWDEVGKVSKILTESGAEEVYESGQSE
jgi:molybdopterin-containing oxidoreductase family membrane subunit